MKNGGIETPCIRFETPPATQFPFFDKDEERVRLMYPVIKIYLRMAAFSNVSFVKVLPLLEVESIQVLIYGPHSTRNTLCHCLLGVPTTL